VRHKNKARYHQSSEEGEENEVEDEEDFADGFEARELAWCLPEDDGEGACRHCACEPWPV